MNTKCESLAKRQNEDQLQAQIYVGGLASKKIQRKKKRRQELNEGGIKGRGKKVKENINFGR